MHRMELHATPVRSLIRGPVTRRILTSLGPVLLLSGCTDFDGPPGLSLEAIPIQELPPLIEVEGVTVRGEGFGSSIAVDPADPNLVWMLSDRGPNFDGPDGGRFHPLPDFTPSLIPVRILTPEVGGLRTTRIETGIADRDGAISLRDRDGRPRTGIPPEFGPGIDQDPPLALGGDRIPSDPGGIDPEGMVFLSDRSFWISEEYGPSLLRFSSSGTLRAEFRPLPDSIGAAQGGVGLPRVLNRRRSNRGFEGVTVDPGSGELVTMLQGPLDNPRAAGRRSVAIRLLVVDPSSGASRQYLYPLDDPDHLVSDIAALGPGRFLVLERDDRFGNDPEDPSRAKRIYRIDLDGATDLSDPEDRPTGRLWGGRTLEEMSPGDREEEGIVPVSKDLVLDLLSIPGGFPHDKAEGMALVDDSTLLVVNDDDFGITDGRNHRPAVKRVPPLEEVDRIVIRRIRLPAPLR